MFYFDRIIPWFIVPEFMPSDVRSLGCSISFAMNQLFMFISVKIFLDMVEMLDAHGTFWVYSGVAAFGTVFVAVFVPETSNLDEAEIEDIFGAGEVKGYSSFEGSGGEGRNGRRGVDSTDL